MSGNPKKLEQEHKRAFPIASFVGDHRRFVETLADAVDHDVSVIAMLTLSYAASTYHDACQIGMGTNYNEGCGIYMMGIMGSSERKTPIVGAMDAPLQTYAAGKVERMQLAHDAWEVRFDELTAASKRKPKEDDDPNVDDDDTATPAAAKTALRRWKEREPNGGNFIVDSNLTGEGLRKRAAENGGAVLITDSEGSRLCDMLLGRYSGGVPEADFLLKAWSASPVMKTRVGSTEPNIARASACLSVLLQPAQAQRLDERLKDIGLLGRCLWALPDARLGYQKAECDPLPPDVERWWRESLHGILRRFDATLSEWDACEDVTMDDRRQVITVPLSPDARRLVSEMHARLNPRLRVGREFEVIKEWGGKSQSHMARIAMAMHALEYPADFETRAINGDTMGRAIEVFEWCAWEARRVAMNVTQNSDSAVVKDLASVSKWVLQRASSGKRRKFTSGQVRNARREFKKLEDLQPYLDELVRKNWITRIDETNYELHPKLGKIDLEDE